MKNFQFIAFNKIFLFLLALSLLGCSYNYDQGVRLEQEERWEEAAIEYRIAFVDDPEDGEIREALARVNLRVAAENFKTYQKFLQKKEYHKAFRRLEAALSQNPELAEARAEMRHWRYLLITGKVELEFDRLASNLRLAEEMQMQVRVNTPDGQILSGNISGESGIFFIEELVYRTSHSRLAEYTVNAIGLKTKRKTPQGFVQKNFKKFINFRELSPLQVQGTLGILRSGILPTPENVLNHRPTLLSEKTPPTPWYPPRLVSYELQLKGDSVQVISESKRSEFAPLVLYLNQTQRRANLDFGVYQLQMNKKTASSGGGEKWSIRRKPYRSSKDDYFYELSRNLALNRYFFYDSVYRFVQ